MQEAWGDVPMSNQSTMPKMSPVVHHCKVGIGEGQAARGQRGFGVLVNSLLSPQAKELPQFPHPHC